MARDEALLDFKGPIREVFVYPDEELGHCLIRRDFKQGET